MSGSGPPLPDGFRHLPGFLDAAAQDALLAAVLASVAAAGWFRPVMPRSGRPFSVTMCNLGPLGWVSDVRGYRYQTTHPATKAAWPAMPGEVMALWRALAGDPREPECCLVNRYGATSKLGLHRDEDEADRTAPVISVSLGDTASFRLGGLERGDPTRRLQLVSGDVVVLGGAARLAFHGVDRIVPGTSALVPGGGRINLTLRRVTLGAGEGDA